MFVLLNDIFDPRLATTYIIHAVSGAAQKSILNGRHNGQGGSATLSGNRSWFGIEQNERCNVNLNVILYRIFMKNILYLCF